IEQVFVVLTFLMFAVQPSAVVVTAGVVLPVDCTKLNTPPPYASDYYTEYAEFASSAVTRFRRSDFIEAMYAFSLVFANFGIAMAARMPMITTTIRSSMSVKPLRFISETSSVEIENQRQRVSGDTLGKGRASRPR